MTRSELDKLRAQLSWQHDLERLEMPVVILRELLDDIDRLEARLREADVALAAARTGRDR